MFESVQKRAPAFLPGRRRFLFGCGGAALAASAAWAAQSAPLPAYLWEAPRFRVTKIGGRWLFVTPQQHPYWLRGVFDVDLATSRFGPDESYRALALAKYGTEAVWARQATRRLWHWGFNALAEYASDYALPIPLYGRSGNPAQMPFMAMIRPSAFSLRNRWGFASGPVKDIVAGIDRTIYTGWRGDSAPDVFDPNFSVYAHREAAALARRLGHSSFLLGVATDDADDLFGFGPGPDVPAARLHPHLGWMVLVTDSRQMRNPALDASYADTKLHSKYALRDWLQRRYRNIAALNNAWGGRYASFGSDGGWPLGRGFLDESGRSAWVGRDGKRLSQANPEVRADLDRFLFLYSQKYFAAVTTAVHRHFAGYLVFGPATLNGWNGLTRAPILRAAGAAVDVLQANAASEAVLGATVAAAGDLPIVTWTGMAANRDSDLSAFPDPSPGAPMFTTQAQRGAAYARALWGEWRRADPAGGHPIAGTKFWAFADSWPEKMNWGLVSLRDNAYDGREAVRARGRDRWGFAIGGERANYGDSVSAIQSANRQLDLRLANWAGAAGGRQ